MFIYLTSHSTRKTCFVVACFSLVRSFAVDMEQRLFNPISINAIVALFSACQHSLFMATVNESNIAPAQVHQRRVPRLQPLSSHVPPAIDRHFEQYLIDHHHFPKLPSIGKPSTSHRAATENVLGDNQEFLSFRERAHLEEIEPNHGPISRLLNSEHYRRAQARLIEYRQRSKIPGVALSLGIEPLADAIAAPVYERQESNIQLKDALLETARSKQQQLADNEDFVDDDSVLSHETDRRRRAKHWIKEHQFFFTEYQ